MSSTDDKSTREESENSESNNNLNGIPESVNAASSVLGGQKEHQSNSMSNMTTNRNTKQKSIRKKIEQYFFQLTKGCQRANCNNPNCASYPGRKQMSGNEAAVKALQLLKEKAEMCYNISSDIIAKEQNLQPTTSSTTSHLDHPESTPMDTTTSSNQSTSEVRANANARSDTESSKAEGDALNASTSGSTQLTDARQSTTVLSMTTTPGYASASVVTPPAEKSKMRQSHKSMIKETSKQTEKKNDQVKRIDYLTEEMIDECIEMCKKAEENENSIGKKENVAPYTPLVRMIGKVFSDIEALSRSFQLPEEYLASEDHKDVVMGVEDNKMEVDQPVSSSMDVADSSSTASSSHPFSSFLNSLLQNEPGSDSAQSQGTSVDGPPQSGLLLEEIRKLSGDIRDKETLKSPKKITVDLKSLRRVYKKLSVSEQVQSALINSLHSLSVTAEVILKQKASKIPNYLNVFVIVLENPSIHSLDYQEKAFPSFCKALASLSVKYQADLAKYWSLYAPDMLQWMVEAFQQLITYTIVSFELPAEYVTPILLRLSKNTTITSAVKALNILYYASLLGGDADHEQDGKSETKPSTNQRNVYSALGFGQDDEMDDFAGFVQWNNGLETELGINSYDCLKPLIPTKEFANELFNSLLDVYREFTIHIMDYGEKKDQFTFMHYPFILNTVNKSTYLFFDNKIRMQSGRRMMVLQSILQGSTLSPYLRLKISRDHVIDDALVRLEMIAEENPLDLRKQLYVEFEGEQGVDEGGVSKEFFQLVVEQIFNPDYGMFTYCEDIQLFWFNLHSFETKAQFTLIGIVLGLAIYNNCILDIKFPFVVYKKLFRKKGRFEDMRNSHPVLYQSLSQLLTYDGNVEEDMMATFSVEYSDMFGTKQSHNLKEDGANIPVTNENREEYVKLYADWLLNESISEQFEAFRQGFELVVAKSPLKSLFSPEELEILISGSQEYDFKVMEEFTEYEGFDKNSTTIKDFWSVVHEMTDEDKKKLLQFTTGTDRAPVGGLGKLKLVISKNGPDSDRLPTAHTCFNVILLPDYRNRDKLKERLHKAITYSKGFGML